MPFLIAASLHANGFTATCLRRALGQIDRITVKSSRLPEMAFIQSENGSAALESPPIDLCHGKPLTYKLNIFLEFHVMQIHPIDELGSEHRVIEKVVCAVQRFADLLAAARDVHISTLQLVEHAGS